MDAHTIIERHERTIYELCEEIEQLQETVNWLTAPAHSGHPPLADRPAKVYTDAPWRAAFFKPKP